MSARDTAPPLEKSFMRRLYANRLVVAVILCACSLAQVSLPQPAPRLREGEFLSPSLQRRAKYRVLVPSSYESGDRSYPVLYLLHGLHGSYEDWTKRTQLEQYSVATEYIIAMPDADN